MERLDDIILYLLYADIAIIIVLALNVIRDKIDFEFYKRLHFKYIILPLIMLLLLGVFLEVIDFEYMPQYITLCGPILAATTSFYIVKINDRKANEKDRLQKLSTLQHVKQLVKGGTKAIETEIKNYNKFVLNLTTLGLKQSQLETTPLVHLDILNNMPSNDIYQAIAISKSGDNSKESEIYLRLEKQIANALFVKRNSEEMYERFNERYNLSANKYIEASYEIDEMYTNIVYKPTGNNLFDQGFLNIIHNYNLGVQTGVINLHSFADVRNHFYTPMLNHVANSGLNHPYVISLLRTLKVFDVSLDKMEELHGGIITHFTQLAKDLTFVNQQFNEILEQLDAI